MIAYACCNGTAGIPKIRPENISAKCVCIIYSFAWVLPILFTFIYRVPVQLHRVKHSMHAYSGMYQPATPSCYI